MTHGSIVVIIILAQAGNPGGPVYNVGVACTAQVQGITNQTVRYQYLWALLASHSWLLDITN